MKEALAVSLPQEIPQQFQQTPSQVYSFITKQQELQQKELLLMQQTRFDGIEKMIKEQFDNLNAVTKQLDIETKRKALEEALQDDDLSVTVSPRQLYNSQPNASALMPPVNQGPLNNSIGTTISVLPPQERPWIVSIVEDWETNHRNSINWTEPNANAKLKDIKFRSPQQKGREGALFLCICHASPKNGTLGVAEELQRIVNTLNLKRTDVYYHVNNLKKAMDKVDWVISTNFRNQLLNVEELSNCMKRRKEEQKKRQEKAKIRRKQTRREKEAADHSKTVEIRQLLFLVAQQANV